MRAIIDSDWFLRLYLIVGFVLNITAIWATVTEARRMAKQPFRCRLCQKEIDEHGYWLGLGMREGESAPETQCGLGGFGGDGGELPPPAAPAGSEGPDAGALPRHQESAESA